MSIAVTTMSLKDFKDKIKKDRTKATFSAAPAEEIPTPEIPISDIKPPSELFPDETKTEPEARTPLTEASRKVTEGSCRMFVNRIRSWDRRYGFEKTPDREQDLKDFKDALTEYCIIKGIIFPPELFLGLAGLSVVTPYAVIGYATVTGREIRPPDEIPDGNAPPAVPKTEGAV